jgi:hypothetical protein
LLSYVPLSAGRPPRPCHPDRRRSWQRPGRVGLDRPPDCPGRRSADDAEPESGASNAGHWGSWEGRFRNKNGAPGRGADQSRNFFWAGSRRPGPSPRPRTVPKAGQMWANRALPDSLFDLTVFTGFAAQAPELRDLVRTGIHFLTAVTAGNPACAPGRVAGSPGRPANTAVTSRAPAGGSGPVGHAVPVEPVGHGSGMGDATARPKTSISSLTLWTGWQCGPGPDGFNF